MNQTLSPDNNPIYQINDMTDAHLEPIMEIEQAAYTHPWSIGNFKDCMTTGYHCWVIEQDNHLIGYVVFSVGANESHLLNICLTPATQGQGIATTVMKTVMKKAKSQQADCMFLEVRDSNVLAIKRYDVIGFHEIGHRTGYYPAKGGREDALILACTL